MAFPVSVLAPGIGAAGTPASAIVPPTAARHAAAGPLGTIADIMQFPVPGGRRLVGRVDAG